MNFSCNYQAHLYKKFMDKLHEGIMSKLDYYVSQFIEYIVTEPADKKAGKDKREDKYLSQWA